MLLKALLGSIDLSPAVGSQADYDLLHEDARDALSIWTTSVRIRVVKADMVSATSRRPIHEAISSDYVPARRRTTSRRSAGQDHAGSQRNTRGTQGRRRMGICRRTASSEFRHGGEIP